ncbi:MAG: hypothetical protein IBX44_05030 [Sulfurospirillum sp.]|nr:hypothetical protein [Sulfurospirillum sp.]
MKFLLIPFFIFSNLLALSITLNSAKEEQAPYALLHVSDAQPFTCEEMIQEFGKKIYLCKFEKVVRTPLALKDMKLVLIDFLEKEKEFYIRIEPKAASKLIPIHTKLYETKEIFKQSKQKKYKHWSILLYEKEPFKTQKIDDGIDFPIFFSKELKPHVGALDLSGTPISAEQSKDIKLYIDIKNAFDTKKYQDVIEDSIKTIKSYPKTIFKSEMLLLRIKAIDALLDETNRDSNNIADKFERSDVAKEAREWIRTFPSNENIPEVLMYLAKSYLNMSQNADANYFLDILISEHPTSSFTKKSILLFADSLYNTRQKNKAIKLYKDVLYSAKDLDVAAAAAIRLVDKELDTGKKIEAKEYLMKVLSANQTYLLRDKEETYRIAQKLANNGVFDVAAKLAELLYLDVQKGEENKEELLRDTGLWYAKAYAITPAYERLQEYLLEYKNGDFSQDVQEALDALFFELQETNESKLANYYETLIERYQNDIGKKALIEKAKLLLAQKRFTDVLKMQDALQAIADENTSQNSQIITDAAFALTNQALNEDNCIQAVGYIEQFTIDPNTLDATKAFECFIRTSRYEHAKTLSLTNTNTKDLKQKLFWLERYLKSVFSTREYPEAIKVANDVLALSKALKTQVNYDVLQYLFFSHVSLDDFDAALKVANQIEKSYKDNFKNIDIFAAILKHANDAQDDLLITQYAQKIIDLQTKFARYIQSPKVEFSYANALKRLGKYQESLVVLKELISRTKEQKDLAKAYYYAAEVSIKLQNNRDAKSYFSQCASIEAENDWREICTQNLKLLP